MTARVIRFPPRRLAAIILEWDGAWLVLTPRGHGWCHGDRDDARDDEGWLAHNWKLSIKDLA